MLSKIQSVMSLVQRRRERAMAIRALSLMNDHQLADIGVERGSLVDMVDGKSVRSTFSYASR